MTERASTALRSCGLSHAPQTTTILGDSICSPDVDVIQQPSNSGYTPDEPGREQLLRWDVTPAEKLPNTDPDPN